MRDHVDLCMFVEACLHYTYLMDKVSTHCEQYHALVLGFRLHKNRER